MTTSIDRLLAYQIESRHYPGALVHVERAGKVLARKAVGMLRPDGDEPMHDGALFRIASLTKAVVSFAALMQVQDGSLALDAPASDYLPVLDNLRMKTGVRPERKPTVRDLMRHTSGLSYPWEIQDREIREIAAGSNIVGSMPHIDSNTFLNALVALPLVAQPGTAFRYGYSTDVLGMIVEKVDGVRLGQSLKTRILDPLGMTETSFEVAVSEQGRLASAYPSDAAWHGLVPGYGIRKADQPWMESGGGGLVTTLGDYVSFARMLSNGGCVGNRRLLSESLFADMRRNQLPDGVEGPLVYTSSGFGFGLGLAVRLDWGPAAMPCAAGEMAWSGISGTAMFTQPGAQWFAVAFTSNMASRMMARMEFRRAVALL